MDEIWDRLETVLVWVALTICAWAFFGLVAYTLVWWWTW